MEFSYSQFFKTGQIVAKTIVTQDKSIDYSNRILTALEDKVEKHNSINERKISLADLRDAYVSGANTRTDLPFSNFTQGEWAMASVNRLLRNILGRVDPLAISIDHNGMEISDILPPSSSDFDSARLDVEEFGVNINGFDPTNDLFLMDGEAGSSFHIEI